MTIEPIYHGKSFPVVGGPLDTRVEWRTVGGAQFLCLMQGNEPHVQCPTDKYYSDRNTSLVVLDEDTVNRIINFTLPRTQESACADH